MGFFRLLPLFLTILLVLLLDNSQGIIPPLGRFLDPVNGAMQAAEPVKKDFSRTLKIKGLQQPVAIDLEDRLVPHIRAQNDHDLYLTQGFLHAYFRLWQMDMQTRAAAGRVSEVAGKKAFKFDRGQRRKGMVYAAENSLKAMEADPRTKAMLDAYTEGINRFIESLHYRDLPLEYKLMDFRPETWTSLRSALLLKYMADDLTGASDDIAYTLLRAQLGAQQFDLLFPEKIKGSDPVIPQGTKFAPASLPQPRFPGDSVWATVKSDANAVSSTQPALHPSESGIGSNNWAISGQHTASGKPILCNDPHLGLNLPSLWFEMQLTAPGLNVYGASLPGAPGIIIGFNESVSWGVTNNYRDVKDYYEIIAGNRETYLFNDRQVAFQKRPERIVIKDSVIVTDTVLYTVHGPVQYEPSFPDPANTGKLLAMCWMAHRGTNELLAVYLMNRAADYNAFAAAIRHFECPAQNFAYADKAGNIALFGQGQFINKWRGQGKFVMEGKDSLTLWGQDIPMNENPQALNPEQGYVASANQNVTDTTYPYWYNGNFSEFRSWAINGLIRAHIQNKEPAYTIEAMMQLQNNVSSPLAKQVFPFMLRALDSVSDRYITSLRSWNGDLKFEGPEASLFQLWWGQLHKMYWASGMSDKYLIPSPERTMQILLSDTGRAGLQTLVKVAYLKARDSLTTYFVRGKTGESTLPLKDGAAWYRVKNTSLTHLARIPAFSYTQLKTGGWGNTINAMKQNHGPSWRMIVEMDEDIRAHAVYPGGQSGNPGSVHYGDYIDKWVAGKYNAIRFVTPRVKSNFPYKIMFTPA